MFLGGAWNKTSDMEWANSLNDKVAFIEINLLVSMMATLAINELIFTMLGKNKY